jgi:uncharacterized protein (DUF1015 family)
MAILKPFKAWRPVAHKVKEIACVPYDVISTSEARKLAKADPRSFLHVIRPEIDVPEDVHIYDANVYEKGRQNLQELLRADYMMQEETDSLYIYRLAWKGKIQTGIFGCVSVQDYDNDVIVKHELTRPPKEDDRTKHILTQEAHAEPVMMTFESDQHIDQLISQTVSGDPIYNFEADDGVTHTLWKMDDSDRLSSAFENVRTIYIADGHHRCASASRAAHELSSQQPQSTQNEEYWYFPAVLFPKSEMNILSYNRIVYSIPDSFKSTLAEKFDLQSTEQKVPTQKGTVTLYLDNTWWSLKLPEAKSNEVADQLDVARLQDHLLTPLLGITDQRTDKNIDFVGGIRGAEELEDLVDSGRADLAIYLYPTSVEELIAVSDARQLMPPKSTWFEPKLRSGILIHTF